jgi:hypothetical protein
MAGPYCEISISSIYDMLFEDSVLVLFSKIEFKHLIFNKVPTFTQCYNKKRHVAMWLFQHQL